MLHEKEKKKLKASILSSRSVMALLSIDKTKKLSKKNERFKAALDHKYREELLGF